MNHLSVFLGICIGSIFGYFILGGHYFLIYLGVLMPSIFWSTFIYYIIKSIRGEKCVNQIK